MGYKEIFLGKDWKEKSWSERLVRLSKMFDVGTVFLVLVAGGLAPAAASALLGASVTTYAAAEIYEKSKKKSK